MPKLIHYRDKCIGCNICHERSPEYWRLSRKDGKATLVGGEKKKSTYVLAIPASEVDHQRDIARDCPARVIKIS